MSKPNSKSYKILVGICSVVVTAAIGYLIVWAGSLNPPGSPASTMHSVDEIAGSGFSSSTHSLVQLYLNVSSTDPGVAKVYYGTNYTIKGDSKTGTLERAGYSIGTISSTYANGETDRFVVDQSGASGAGITATSDVATDKYAWSNGTWYGPGTLSRGVTKTGQTTSYATTSQTCGDGGTGGCDDGYYEKGLASSYTDNGDGTVTDNNTGLMWKKCSEPDTSTTTCAGIHSPYTWQNAINRCEGLSYAGYTDWRLPNAKELWNITKLQPGAFPYIDQTAFPGTEADYYWSATTYPSGTTEALFVDFLIGYLSNLPKTGTLYVRCVRGGQIFIPQAICHVSG